ncbi:DUF7255 family protein [Cupriavidus sp. PET2-C1]
MAGSGHNRSCERQFGVGSAQKILEGAGAPRRKQRAFYDFVKDLCPKYLASSLLALRFGTPSSIAEPGAR